MRIRDPLVLRVVGKSILQTSLAVILILGFLYTSSIILVSLLWRFIQIIDTIYQWRNICQTTPNKKVGSVLCEIKLKGWKNSLCPLQ